MLEVRPRVASHETRGTVFLRFQTGSLSLSGRMSCRVREKWLSARGLAARSLVRNPQKLLTVQQENSKISGVGSVASIMALESAE